MQEASGEQHQGFLRLNRSERADVRPQDVQQAPDAASLSRQVLGSQGPHVICKDLLGRIDGSSADPCSRRPADQRVECAGAYPAGFGFGHGHVKGPVARHGRKYLDLFRLRIGHGDASLSAQRLGEIQFIVELVDLCQQQLLVLSEGDEIATGGRHDGDVVFSLQPPFHESANGFYGAVEGAHWGIGQVVDDQAQQPGFVGGRLRGRFLRACLATPGHGTLRVLVDFLGERLNGLLLAVFEDLEIVHGQIGNGVPVPVGDNGVDHHHFYRHLEGESRGGLPVGFFGLFGLDLCNCRDWLQGGCQPTGNHGSRQNCASEKGPSERHGRILFMEGVYGPMKVAHYGTFAGCGQPHFARLSGGPGLDPSSGPLLTSPEVR